MKLKEGYRWMVSIGGIHKQKDILEVGDRAVGYATMDSIKVHPFERSWHLCKMFNFAKALEKAREKGVLED